MTWSGWGMSRPAYNLPIYLQCVKPGAGWFTIGLHFEVVRCQARQ